MKVWEESEFTKILKSHVTFTNMANMVKIWFNRLIVLALLRRPITRCKIMKWLWRLEHFYLPSLSNILTIN